MEKRLKKGDIGPDGRVFWAYVPKCKNGEYWLTPEKYASKADHAKQLFAAWSKKNAERLRERERIRYLKNKDDRRAKIKKWREENKEHLREYQRKHEPIWREGNRDKVRAQNARWAKKNPARIRAYAMARIAKKKGATPAGYDLSLLTPIYEACKRVSDCLRIPHEVDHIVPLSRGGAHHHDNLQILPKVLNARKSNKLDFALPMPA